MAATTTTFPHFTDLPLEIQLYIWDLVLQDFAFVHIDGSWHNSVSHPTTSPATATAIWPILPVPAPRLGDPPGLIPYRLPAGTPATLASHPPPMGIPASRARGVDWQAYMRAMLTPSRKLVRHAAPGVAWHFDHFWAAVEAAVGLGMKGEGSRSSSSRGFPELLAGVDDAVACFSACRASRLQAMRRAVVNTGQSVPLSLPQRQLDRDDDDDDGDGDDDEWRIRFRLVRNGVVFENVFQDPHQYRSGDSSSSSDRGRPCLVYAIAANGADPTAPPELGRDFLPFKTGGVVAARLADIERCVFGNGNGNGGQQQRLSLTRCPPGLDAARFRELRLLMWWQPELGARARRPEANYPLHCPPASILWIYSSILHSVALRARAARARARTGAKEGQQRQRGGGMAEGGEGDGEEGGDGDDATSAEACLCPDGTKMSAYLSGAWYFGLLEMGGRCPLCRVPLVDELRRWCPELLDREGCLDVVVLRDRDSVERPEATLSSRSHEIFV
ncbi:hypothetical protein SLS62_000066 [Diatrype stigma]|uniref:Uncharacterized protein n=1 Tax=Diatrype stigma TaxID=117547 RepID=A0AAN9UY22_9PEZI